MQRESSGLSPFYSGYRKLKKVVCHNSSYKETFEIRKGEYLPGHPIQPLQRCRQPGCMIWLIKCLNSTLKDIKLFLFSFTAAMGRLL